MQTINYLRILAVPLLTVIVGTSMVTVGSRISIPCFNSSIKNSERKSFKIDFKVRPNLYLICWCKFLKALEIKYIQMLSENNETIKIIIY